MSRSFESYHMDQILFLREHSWPGRTLGELVWTLSHRNILEFAEEVPADRLLRVRFEDLVADPRGVMTEMASFLGLDFDESLVRPYEHLEKKMVDGLHPESTPMGDTRLLERDRIDPDVVERWVRNGRESALGEPTLRLARRFGYTEYGPSVDAGERRRFADATRRRRAAGEPMADMVDDDALRDEVVIVGMAGRFPGAASVDELWANLRAGVESIRPLRRTSWPPPVSTTQWRLRMAMSPRERRSTMRTRSTPRSSGTPAARRS